MSLGPGWGASPVQPPKPPVAGLVLGLVLFFVGSILGGILVMSSFMRLGPEMLMGTAVYPSDSGQHPLLILRGEQKTVWISPYVPASCEIRHMYTTTVPIDTSAAGTRTAQGYTLLGTFYPGGIGMVEIECTSEDQPFTYRVESMSWGQNQYTGVILGGALAGASIIVGLALAITTGMKMMQANRQAGAAAMRQAPQPPH